MMTKLNANLLRGTLDLLVLHALKTGPQHGYGILEWIERAVAPELLVEEGTLYPALHRLERDGWVRSEWGASGNNRKAKYYRLTARGRRRAEDESKAWQAQAQKVWRVLEGTAEA
jgi:PadR family transcriptional regulator